jgi:hypothetical protein
MDITKLSIKRVSIQEYSGHITLQELLRKTMAEEEAFIKT